MPINTLPANKESWEKEKIDKLYKYLSDILEKPNTPEWYQEIERDLNLLKKTIEDGKDVTPELWTKYELQMLKWDVLQGLPENQVWYNVQEFFQTRANKQPEVLRANGPWAKDIKRNRLGDNGWTWKNLPEKQSAAKNITLWQNIQINPEQFKKDFVEVKGNGKIYRERHQADIPNIPMEIIWETTA